MMKLLTEEIKDACYQELTDGTINNLECRLKYDPWYKQQQQAVTISI